MHWDIQDGLLIACEMKQQHHQPSARTNMHLKSMPSCSLSAERWLLKRVRRGLISLSNRQQQQYQLLQPLSSAGRATSVVGVCRNVGISTSIHTATAAPVASLLNRNASPHQISAAISRCLSTREQSNVLNILASSRMTAATHKTPQDASRSPSQSPESNDDELRCVVDKLEQELSKNFLLDK